MSILKKLYNKVAGSDDSSLGKAFDVLQQTLRHSGQQTFVSANGTGLSLGLEGFSENALAQNDLETSVESLTRALTGLENYSPAQREAATYAGMISGDIGAFLRQKTGDQKGMTMSSDDIGRISPALESYDEKENRAASIFTVTYNLRAARQDEFGEAFFPTVVVAPDQQGYHVHINLINLISGIRRKANGEAGDWNRHNLVHVIRNPSLIDSSSTKLIPVYRAGNESYFVDTALVSSTTVDINGEQVTTAPLAIGKSIELIALSQTDLQLERMYMDETDSIDTDIQLKSIYLKVGDDVLRYPVSHLPGAQFHYPVQGDQQRMDVRLETEVLSIGPTTKTAGGAVLDTLQPVVTGDIVVYLRTVVTGSVVRDKGETEMNASAVRVVKIIDANKDVHLPSSLQYAAIVALFANAQVIGYDLDTRRTNLNRRSIGQMLETRQEVQAYAVPLLSPFTVKRPQGLNDTTDQSDLASLVTLTRAMASGKAVDELFKAAETLKAYVQEGRRSVGDNLRILGVGSHLITAHYEYKEIKVDELAMSRNSAELAANIQAAIINVIRDMVFRGYQISGWKAAADMLEGGDSKKPTVVIGTDQTLGRYLQVSGDLRTIGGGFDDYLIVDTQNDKMKGKIFIAFMPAGVAEGTPHPLQLGNMAWKPEVAVVLPIHRNGANSKELTVQPAFRHVVNTPFLLEIDVTGIPETVETRVPNLVEGALDMTDVTPP